MQSPIIEGLLKGCQNQSKEQLMLPFERELETASGYQRLNYLEVKEKGRAVYIEGSGVSKKYGYFFLSLSGKVESRNKSLQQTFHDIFKLHSRFSQIFTESTPPNWAALKKNIA